MGTLGKLARHETFREPVADLSPLSGSRAGKKSIPALGRDLVAGGTSKVPAATCPRQAFMRVAPESLALSSSVPDFSFLPRGRRIPLFHTTHFLCFFQRQRFFSSNQLLHHPILTFPS